MTPISLCRDRLLSVRLGLLLRPLDPRAEVVARVGVADLVGQLASRSRATTGAAEKDNVLVGQGLLEREFLGSVSTLNLYTMDMMVDIR